MNWKDEVQLFQSVDDKLQHQYLVGLQQTRSSSCAWYFSWWSKLDVMSTWILNKCPGEARIASLTMWGFWSMCCSEISSAYCRCRLRWVHLLSVSATLSLRVYWMISYIVTTHWSHIKPNWGRLCYIEYYDTSWTNLF